MPRSSKRSADAALAAAARFRRSELWNGFLRGDAVKIAGIRGGHWRFRCHVENLETGSSWIEVDELDLPRGAVPPPAAGRAREASAADNQARHLPVRRVRAFSEERVLRGPRPRRRRAAEPDHAVQPAPHAPSARLEQAVQLSLEGLFEEGDFRARKG